MEYEESKAKAAVLLDSLIQSFSTDDDLLLDKKTLHETFEHIFKIAYEAGRRDGIDLALSESQKNK